MTPLPMYLAGKFVTSSTTKTITNPYNNEVIAEVAMAQRDELEQATQAAVDSFEACRALEPYQRADILRLIVEKMTERQEEFAQTLTKENGKTIKESRGEVTRAISTFLIAAGEAERVYGESYDAGITKGAAGRRVLVRKFPIGPVAAIAPFNFPLNLSVHKIAPAIAAGCPIVLKPASATPLSCLLLSEIIDQTDWPKGAFSCLPCTREAGQMLVEDERYKLLSFTGSPQVGWKMKADAGKKPVVLELGGNAALLIDNDVSDWDHVIKRAAIGAFYQSGQVCISVQHIYVHEDVYETFKTKFKNHVESLVIGDPLKETTDIGPIIDEKNLNRLHSWVAEAADEGATVLSGNEKVNNALKPTIVEGTSHTCALSAEEAFGPVVNIHKVKNMDEAIKKANDTKFGLQVGIFSNNFVTIQQVFNEMDVGGVIVNDTPAFRVDHMPYGGVKDSGLGREGIKYAMEDMLEEKVMVYFS